MDWSLHRVMNTSIDLSQEVIAINITLRAFNPFSLQDYFNDFCSVFPGSHIFISDQNFNARNNIHRNCIFIPSRIPMVARWITSFVLEILQNDVYGLVS